MACLTLLSGLREVLPTIQVSKHMLYKSAHKMRPPSACSTKLYVLVLCLAVK